MKQERNWSLQDHILLLFGIFLKKILPNTIFGSFFYKDNKQIINIGLFLPKIIIKQIIFRIISVFALEFFPNAPKLI